MLGFHRRARSLISVQQLGKHEKVNMAVYEVHDDEADHQAARKSSWTARKQLIVIYILFLAEAIMASSLQPQLKMLVGKDDFCSTLSASYIRSILDCAYAFGGIGGLFWGWLSDRIGRRPIALIGILGMSGCCMSMGFATNLPVCALLRFFGGLLSSSNAVTTLAMIGDVSNTRSERVKNVARLPFIAACGSVGPLVQGLVRSSVKSVGEIWQKFPLLSSEIACGGLVLLIGIGAVCLLDETLPSIASPGEPLTLSTDSIDCEKAAFLNQDTIPDDASQCQIQVIDADRPDPISLCQIIKAPSLLVLLSSFSLLSLHSSTFDTLLPHLGHSSIHSGGMGIPCSALGLIVLCLKLVAGSIVLAIIPKIVERVSLLRPYRAFSVTFPIIYLATPLVAQISYTCFGDWLAVVSTLSILLKNIFAGSAQVLVALLMLSIVPDAYSTGTILGLMQSASLFKAFAVAVSGMSFYYSGEVGIATTNYVLWACLVAIGIAGAALAWFVRERPSLAKDYRPEVLKWETCFDAEGDGLV
ncbi:MFS general substrate transporter [Xylona heveae TC161]|uniref:MFS general substrate transporter n=1 Tax=Xylona heveae (strain CBS 132557 / TC161) TaxID=1328760 RepID=A0A161TD85_XYLHT|nr:MFS general substrate transporter [Xylona heveae TC161]KZF23787.1 MFS general substrate transporter [Xylona heveae TC161]